MDKIGAIDAFAYTPAIAAPIVTADDGNNVIVGANENMEYSVDGGLSYTAYRTAQIPTFSGNQTVLVRFAANETNAAGLTKSLTFTANPIEQAASLTGPGSVAAGAPFIAAYGLNHAGEVYAQDLTITYNPDLVTFLSAKSLKEGLVIVKQAEKPGQIRFITASTGVNSANAVATCCNCIGKLKRFYMPKPQISHYLI